MIKTIPNKPPHEQKHDIADNSCPGIKTVGRRPLKGFAGELQIYVKNSHYHCPQDEIGYKGSYPAQSVVFGFL